MHSVWRNDAVRVKTRARDLGGPASGGAPWSALADVSGTSAATTAAATNDLRESSFMRPPGRLAAPLRRRPPTPATLGLSSRVRQISGPAGDGSQIPLDDSCL